MLKEETKEINGRVFQVKQMVPTHAIKMQAKLLSVITPLAEVFESSEVKLSDLSKGDDVDPRIALKAIGSIMEACGEEKITNLLFELVKCAKLQNEQGTFYPVVDIDEQLHGFDTLSIAKVAMFVLTVNFKNFFPSQGR